LLAVGGKNLVLLAVQPSGFQQISTCSLDHEISCLNINPIAVANHTGKPRVFVQDADDLLILMSARLCFFYWADMLSASFAAVGLWDVSVRLLALPSLKEVTREALGGGILPRTILFATFVDVSSLLFYFLLSLLMCYFM
jgi:DNA damage-binding protein 1